MYRIFLVEDSAAVRQRVVAMLSKIEGVSTVGSASTVRDAESAILATQPDAVLLDIKLAGGSGFELLRSLRTRAPHIDVFMLSNFAARPYRDRAASLGARGFFDKTIELESMRRTIAGRAARSMH